VVPAGYTGDGRNPFGLSFLADAFSEAELISFAFDYEQATKLRVPPTEVNAALVPKSCG
jgi:amidase